MRESDNQTNLSSEGLDAQLIADLQRQSMDQIQKLRAHERVAVKMPVVLQPGNSSQLHELKLEGLTGDISEGGCAVVFDAPVNVGDVYRLQIDSPEHDLPLVFARAVRCRMMRETAFEVGFRFFNPLRLPKTQVDEDLLP